MMTVIGSIGAFLLGVCSVPLALQSYREKKSDISGAFLWTWFIGEILTFIYALHLKDIPLTLNYLCNILLIGVVIYYKLFPKK